MEWLCVDRVDTSYSFLDDPEQDDGLEKNSMLMNILDHDMRETKLVTYLLSVSIRVVEPVRPVNDTDRLGAILEEVVVGGLVHLLHLIATEDESLNSPIGMLDVENLNSGRCYDAKVMASALDGPPEVRVRIDCPEGSICQNDVHRNELIGDETMVSLKPPVSTPECGPHIANTLTGSSH